MTIRDVNSACKFFKELEGGAIFRHAGFYYCKLSEVAYLPTELGERMESYNTVNLHDGFLCDIGDNVAVEILAGHTLELSD